jgi:hypothetical protein
MRVAWGSKDNPLMVPSSFSREKMSNIKVTTFDV